MDYLSVFFGIITLVSLGYAVWSDRRRKSIEDFLDGSLTAVRKSLLIMKGSASDAKRHFDILSDLSLEIPREEAKKEAVKRAKYGRSDVKAVEAAHDVIQNQLEVLAGKAGKQKKPKSE